MVKKTKGAIVGWVPGSPPADLPPSARQYLDEELNRAAVILQMLLTKVAALEAANQSN